MSALDPQAEQPVILRLAGDPSCAIGQPRGGDQVSLAGDPIAFIVRPGTEGLGISLEAADQPGTFLRHAGFIARLNANDGSALFAKDATFTQHDPGDGGIRLESVNFVGHFLVVENDRIALRPVDPATASAFRVEAAGDAPIILCAARRPAAQICHARLGDALVVGHAGIAFHARPGLAGDGVSFESANQPGAYLRHQNRVAKLHLDDGSALFRHDATFRLHEADGGVRLESLNFPGHFLGFDGGDVVLRAAELTDADVFGSTPAGVVRPHVPRVQRFALVLGADAYLDPDLADLKGCRNDVIDTVVTLIAKGLVPPGNCKPVASPSIPHAEFARRMAPWGADPAEYEHVFAEIHSHDMRPCYLRWAVAELRDAMARTRAAGDVPMLFLFWSGHGGLIDDRLAFRLPGYFPDEQAWIRTQAGLPDEICALPDAEFDRTQIAYHELIEMLGMQPEESVFAVIGSCHAGAVLEGVTGKARSNDLIFTAGTHDTTLHERYLDGRWRGLLSWSILRVLEQFELQADDPVKAGLDLSFGQLLQTIRSMILALQGNTATAWLPQLRGALKGSPEQLADRVGQLFTAESGATSSKATKIGGSIEWPPDTCYELLVAGVSQGYLYVTTSDFLHIDTDAYAALFASAPSSLTLKPQSLQPTPGPKKFTSTKFGAAVYTSSTASAFKITKGGSLVGYLVPTVSGSLEWYVKKDSSFLNSAQTYLDTTISLSLDPVSSVPSDDYHTAIDDPA